MFFKKKLVLRGAYNFIVLFAFLDFVFNEVEEIDFKKFELKKLKITDFYEIHIYQTKTYRFLWTWYLKL
jgi:hypothetical protein